MKTYRTLPILLVVLSAVGLVIADAPKPTHPNIIFILADDLGYGDLGCYGQKRILTPNLDRMAAEGMRFTQFYAGDTVCAPSRCTLMTGMHTGHCLIRGNATVPLRPQDVTVAEVLKGVGYRTGLVGKWGLGEAGSTGVPNRQGFDYFYGYLSQVKAHNYYPDYLWKNQQKIRIEGNVVKGGVASKRAQYSHRPFHEGSVGLRRPQSREAVLPLSRLHDSPCERRTRRERGQRYGSAERRAVLRINRGRRRRRTMRRWSRGSTRMWAGSSSA